MGGAAVLKRMISLVDVRSFPLRGLPRVLVEEPPPEKKELSVRFG